MLVGFALEELELDSFKVVITELTLSNWATLLVSEG
jgi:hypothetical protein